MEDGSRFVQRSSIPFKTPKNKKNISKKDLILLFFKLAVVLFAN